MSILRQRRGTRKSRLDLCRDRWRCLSLGLFFLGRYTARATQARLLEQRHHEKSIAVLPFENLSDDKANAYFADGIQDEILTRLRRSPI